MVQSILKQTYPDKDYAATFASLFEGESNNNQANFKETIVKLYLEAMGIKPEEVSSGSLGTVYDIPDQNINVLVIPRKFTNFDKHTLKGTGLISKRFAEVDAASKNKKQVTILVSELLSIKDDMSRVNFLVSRGILSNKSNNSYDFSAIKKKNVEESELESKDVEEPIAPEITKDYSTTEDEEDAKVAAQAKKQASKAPKQPKDKTKNSEASAAKEK